MIASKLNSITAEAKAKLAALPTSARKSARLIIVEEYQDQMEAALAAAGKGITDAEKIAFFDACLKLAVEIAGDEIENGGEGDDDNEHWCYEQLLEGTLGAKVFDALNAVEEIVGSDIGNDD